MKRNSRAGLGSLSGFSLNVLSDDELYELHLATLEVLQHTGVKVESLEALDIFDGGGANVDRKNHIVKIPPHVVEDAIRSAPAKIVLAGRNPKNDVVLEGRRVHFTNFGEGLMINDPFTGEYRKTTKEDVANTAKVVDALDAVDVYERAVDARDVYPGVGALHEAEAFFNNTSKHCFMGPGSKKLAEMVLEMATAVAGGKEQLK
jgi:trimethylamine--corrinoid protein Co-methyltransferase